MARIKNSALVALTAAVVLLAACKNPLLDEIKQRVSDYQANLSVAEFSVSRSSGCVPLNVSFTDLSSSGGPVTSWSWNFGDGSTSTAQNPSHRYTRQGIFTVTLNVSGPGGSDSEVKAACVRAATFDVNGDGYSDYAVGQPNYGSHYNGRAYVFSGADASTLYTKDAESEEDYFGIAVSDAGDVNADGYGDFIIGAYGYKNWAYQGRAYVYSGLNGSALHVKTGEASFQYFGQAVSGVGDVDGDGYSDFAVGAPSYPNQTNNRYGGKLYLYSGDDGTLMYSEEGWMPPDPDYGGDRLGYSIGRVGDLNGDGRDEFIVGAPNANSGYGRIYIYSHNGSSVYKYRTINALNTHNEFGAAVNGCGDVDADGVPDYIVGDPSFGGYGRVRVYSGANGTELDTEVGTYGGDNFGVSVSGADFNQDGYSDYLVGNSYYQGGTYKGMIRVFSGQTGSSLYTIYGMNDGDRFGQSVSAGGDINGDGNPDFIVGAYGYSSFAGKAYVYSGASGVELTSRTKTGTDNDNFGRSVSNGR